MAMDPIEEYLLSPQAPLDVADLLARYASGEYRLGCDKTAGPDLWSLDKHAAWQRVRYADATIYFKPADDDGYVVTDLGEAVHVLRLRTGIVWPTIPDADGVTEREGVLHAAPSPVPTTDLPRAIVSVLLAAYRIAHLKAGR